MEHQTIYQSEDDGIGYMPGLIDEGTEELLGQEIYKAQFIESYGYPRDPSGPIKEEQVEDSSELPWKSVKFQIVEDKVIEAYVTHWQELEEQDQVQQGQEQDTKDRNLPDQAESVGAQDHNYRHGADFWTSVD